MHTGPVSHSLIVPERCYRDARGALAFLESAFGFTPSLVVPGEGATIAHAELWAGCGCIMLGSVNDVGPWQFRVPREIGGVTTGSAYLAVDDLYGLYERAKAAGASLEGEPTATDYGSLDFSARDPEGFLWHFGTYRPERAELVQTITEPELFAGMRYADAPAAIDWLCRAFGFAEQLVVPGENGEIAHAQLELGGSVLMIGSARADRFNMKTPREIDGRYTQTLNVSVDDPDAHYARAQAAGADLISAPADTTYGARGYTARDGEGFVWSFSTYRPIRSATAQAVSVPSPA